MRNCVLLLLGFPLSALAQQKEVARYVNPLIGTQRMGHTFPGATAPFGLVQLSPDTDTLPYELNGKYNPDVYKYCAGYQYDDKTIVGLATRTSVVPAIATVSFFNAWLLPRSAWFQ